MMEVQGKIFVVALVVSIIVIGLGIFLFWMEAKLRKLSRKMDELEANNQN
jgi:hypothetical protein